MAANSLQDPSNKPMSHHTRSHSGHNTSGILPLSADAIAQIHSSKQITSLQGVVLALLENSLDANATKVDISFSSSRGACIVEDNGSGIPSSEFLDAGGLSKMYHTSKANSAPGQVVHGSTGTYLASLSALSLLSITSRHLTQEQSASLTIHQGRTIDRQTPSLPSSELSTFGSHGTCVSVRDLFGNMPVRVKQRILASEVGPSGNEKTWNELKYGIAALLLSWRSPCFVRMRDADVSARSITISGSHPSVSAALTEKSLNQLQGKTARYDLRDALPIVFQIGLASQETRHHWVPISASTLQLSVRGTICLDPAPTKQCQFVSIGVQPCSANSGHSEVYESINRVFAASSFGTEDEEQLDETEKDRRKRDRRFKADGYTQKQIRGSKGIDRWPMLVLQIKLHDYERSAGSMKHVSDHQLKGITDVLEAMVEQWLAANNFRPRKKRKRKNQEQSSPAAVMASPFLVAGRDSPKLDTAQRSASGLRRTVTSDGTMPPRQKRRIVDLSGGATHFEGLVSPGSQNFNAMPNNWSRIKSSTRGFTGRYEDRRKVSTAPSGAGGSADTPAPPINSPFSLPTLEPGSLAPLRTSVIPVVGHAAEPAVETNVDVEEDSTTVSSDYFGSVGDNELLEAVGIQTALHATPSRGHQSIPLETEDVSKEETVEWTNPITHQVFKVNSRTGVVLPVDSARQPAASTASTSAGRPLTLARRGTSVTTPSTNSTLPINLRKWQNPVFALPKEKPIPIASISGPGTEPTDLAHKYCTHQDFSGTGVATHIKLSKATLASAKAIAQVDKKFILCAAPSPTSMGTTLLLIDQHAASERIILETLLADLCAHPTEPAGLAIRTNTKQTPAVTTTPLASPAHFEISNAEHALFATHAPHFARWGMLYDLFPPLGPSAFARQPDLSQQQHEQGVKKGCKIAVRALPPPVAERCRLFPQLLIGLLRGEVWSVAQNLSHGSARHRTATFTQTAPSAPISKATASAEATSGEGDGPTWLNALGAMPRGLQDMLASRACRSAVMFNDSLSVRECEELVGQLGRSEKKARENGGRGKGYLGDLEALEEMLALVGGEMSVAVGTEGMGGGRKASLKLGGAGKG